MPKIDLSAVPERTGGDYPAPFAAAVRARRVRRLGDAVGLTQFGVSLVHLPPGAWSSQRHWHERQDELVYVLSGELVLVTDAGEEPLRAGECAAFKAGVRDGHHLQNRSSAEATFLVAGTRTSTDAGEYSDIDMVFRDDEEGSRYLHKDGTPY
jgi:uncharacterized cupin superfamily protein